MKRAVFFCLVFFSALTAMVYGDPGLYSVKKGDTLFGISRAFGIPVAVLKSVNRLSSEALAIGQKLTIPEAYSVKKGDTLYSIGRRYGMSADDIAALNGLARTQPLKVNQKIYVVPEGGGKTVQRTPGPATASSEMKNNRIFWPLPGKRESYEGKMKGVLICGEKGDLVYSVSKGRIMWAAPYRGFGNVVLVDSGEGLVYGYLGIEELIVSAGEAVESGSALGRIGRYFHQTDAKLLFIIYHNVRRIYLDPQEVLNSAADKLS